MSSYDMGRARLLGAIGLACFGCSGGATAESETGGSVYRVGPGAQFEDLRDVAPQLEPGDLVEVTGGVTYPGGVLFATSGTAEQKIVVRGIRDQSGARPVLDGAATGTPVDGAEDTVHLAGDHFVLEGFEITRGNFRCVFHQADDVTVRDTWVHDCAGHGILGADEGAGSLTLEGVEVSGSGAGDTRHPIYVATDEQKYPNARFSMVHSYVHDNHGGDSVKSRAQRNDIHYNWIAGSSYFELDLVGPEVFEEYLAREDSDIVGNVFEKTVDGGVLRAGGDGSGQSFGRYRFAHNTVLLAPQAYSAPIHLTGGVESLELHANVFHRPGNGDEWAVLNADDVQWTQGAAALAATRNWLTAGAAVPADWIDTLGGTDPGFVDVGASDLRPAPGSPLVDQGGPGAALLAELRVPSALEVPLFVPPIRAAALPGIPRVPIGSLDIGAFESGE
jgi:hypothetical protein